MILITTFLASGPSLFKTRVAASKKMLVELKVIPAPDSATISNTPLTSKFSFFVQTSAPTQGRFLTRMALVTPTSASGVIQTPKLK